MILVTGQQLYVNYRWCIHVQLICFVRMLPQHCGNYVVHTHHTKILTCRASRPQAVTIGAKTSQGSAVKPHPQK